MRTQTHTLKIDRFQYSLPFKALLDFFCYSSLLRTIKAQRNLKCRTNRLCKLKRHIPFYHPGCVCLSAEAQWDYIQSSLAWSILDKIPPFSGCDLCFRRDASTFSISNFPCRTNAEQRNILEFLSFPTNPAEGFSCQCVFSWTTIREYIAAWYVHGVGRISRRAFVGVEMTPNGSPLLRKTSLERLYYPLLSKQNH